MIFRFVCQIELAIDHIQFVVFYASVWFPYSPRVIRPQVPWHLFRNKHILYKCKTKSVSTVSTVLPLGERAIITEVLRDSPRVWLVLHKTELSSEVHPSSAYGERNSIEACTFMQRGIRVISPETDKPHRWNTVACFRYCMILNTITTIDVCSFRVHTGSGGSSRTRRIFLKFRRCVQSDVVASSSGFVLESHTILPTWH